MKEKKNLYPVTIPHSFGEPPENKKKQSPPYGTDSYVSSVKTASKPRRVYFTDPWMVDFLMVNVNV